MQTFLPYSDYEASAQTLDNKRLNKQILEGYQILKVLSGASPSVHGAIIQQYLCGNAQSVNYAVILVT